MNKRVLMLCSSVLLTDAVLGACEHQEDDHVDTHEHHKKENDKISTSEFNKMPYHNYYSKSDLEKTNTESHTLPLQFKNDDLQKTAMKKMLKDANQTYYDPDVQSKEAADYVAGSGEHFIQPNYSLNKDDEFKSPMYDLKVDKTKIYEYRDLIHHKYSLPFKVKDNLDSATLEASKNSDGDLHEIYHDNNEGVVRVDITAKNKSPENMYVTDLASVASDKDNETDVIGGQFTIDGKTYKSSSHEILSLVNSDFGKVKPGQEVQTSLYYIVHDNIKKDDLDLVSKFEIGDPFDREDPAFKQFVKVSLNH